MASTTSPLYAPVTRDAQGGVTVQLGDDHPGVNDPAYRARRNELASLSADWQPGDPIPRATYTDIEHHVWEVVSGELAPRHQQRACRSYIEAKDRLGLPADHVPQLDDVSALLEPIAGFRYLPVAGLAPLRGFYGAFSDDFFFSTQYIRHHSVPLYTPEPDIIHEVIGHANQLADPAVADVYRSVGRAVHRTTSEDALRALSKVFWFTVEFGVVEEHGEPKAFGAGILSSYGEMETFQSADIRSADLTEMATADYDITRYQPVLYSFRSTEHLLDELRWFCDSYDDEAYGRLQRDLAS